jgi:hypothetical protein
MNNRSDAQNFHFAICLDNQGYQASLEISKVYRVIHDPDAESNGLIRVFDESGEDYAFAIARFHGIELPQRVEAVLLAAG